MIEAPEESGVYLLHFSEKVSHAQHYVGFAENIRRRVDVHLAGGCKASPLVRAAIRAGVQVTLTRVWPGLSRNDERSIKNRKGTPKLCPVCREESLKRAAINARRRRENAPARTDLRALFPPLFDNVGVHLDGLVHCSSDQRPELSSISSILSSDSGPILPGNGEEP